MRFVKKFTPPDLQAKNLHRQFHLISTVLVIKTQKNEWKWRNLHSWQKFYTATGSDGMDKSHLWYRDPVGVCLGGTFKPNCGFRRALFYCSRVRVEVKGWSNFSMIMFLLSFFLGISVKQEKKKLNIFLSRKSFITSVHLFLRVPEDYFSL